MIFSWNCPILQTMLKAVKMSKMRIAYYIYGCCNLQSQCNCVLGLFFHARKNSQVNIFAHLFLSSYQSCSFAYKNERQSAWLSRCSSSPFECSNKTYHLWSYWFSRMRVLCRTFTHIQMNVGFRPHHSYAKDKGIVKFFACLCDNRQVISLSHWPRLSTWLCSRCNQGI